MLPSDVYAHLVKSSICIVGVTLAVSFRSSKIIPDLGLILRDWKRANSQFVILSSVSAHKKTN